MLHAFVQLTEATCISTIMPKPSRTHSKSNRCAFAYYLCLGVSGSLQAQRHWWSCGGLETNAVFIKLKPHRSSKLLHKCVSRASQCFNNECCYRTLKAPDKSDASMTSTFMLDSNLCFRTPSFNTHAWKCCPIHVYHHILAFKIKACVLLC